MGQSLLREIKSPQDLKQLTLDELEALAGEIRSEIISTVERTGGHLGANLGVVELTLALHSTLSSPRDRIVWDVGHQCYPHKLVTGRREGFHTLRQWQGLSGFPLPKESEHDHFGVGHSSTSISAAAGMAIARDLRGEDYHVVAVMGDGALTGGMAFEALNHMGSLGTDLVVILNDNEMSITNNVGALSDYLGRIRSDTRLYRAREDLSAFLRKIPVVGNPVAKMAHYFKNTLKNMLPGQLFEELGFTYLGPFDGHNIAQLQRAIGAALNRRGPVLLHVYTQKGRGHAQAEENPHRYHGVGPLRVVQKVETMSYSEVFGRTVAKLARENPDVVAITAAMRDGTGLGAFAREFPDRFFDVGIAEQHALTLAAGMAKNGLRPFAAIYSTFLQRGYDQIIHDIALQKLPVVIAVDRAGVVGDDGPTHHGVFDISFLRLVPNLTILAPRNGAELAAMLHWAFRQPGPVAIRYPRAQTAPFNGMIELNWEGSVAAQEIKGGRDCVIFAVGPLVEVALEAARGLEPEFSCSVVNVRSLKPLDRALLLKLARATKCVLTLEDNVLAGGFGSGVLELLAAEKGVRVERLGYPDQFIPQGSISQLHGEYGLTAEYVARTVRSALTGKIAPLQVGRD
ncbi:MAG TPA: 1-deoxy-D-xylulose-5-phosphate synthase [Firmicutes bacterium]|nr:1-deoxy-D-xylulose-5-phosphate synthase [Bacillota bacterium]